MPPEADADWRAALDALAAAAAPGPAPARGSAGSDASDATPLGLQFELRHRVTRRPGHWQGPSDEPATRAAAVDRLGVRPVQQGARGTWIKGTLTWQNVAYLGASKGYDPDQARWFGQFAVLKGASPTVFTGYSSEWLTLDEYESPVLWAMLAEARRLGIALVGSDVTPRVGVHATGAVALDAVDDLDGFRLTPTAVFGAAGHPIGGVRPIGEHGMYRADFDAGVLELAPVDGGLGAAQRALLGRDASAASGDVIRVPSPELPVFLRRDLPRLARAVPVVSLDGSFVPPDPDPPELVLRVRFERGDAARLDWRWEHVDGRAEPVDEGGDEAERAAAGVASGRPVASDSGGASGQPVASDPTDATGLDDDALDVLARVRDELGGLPLGAIVVRGEDVAWFADRALPRLEAIERVRVEVRGERPDYRELTEAPELTVSTVESRQRDWFDLGVMVTVQGRSIPFMPLFRALARGQKRLLLVDKTYLSLEQPVFEPLRELIEEAGTLAEWETGLRIHRSQVGLWADFEDLADVAEPAVAWRNLVTGLASSQTEVAGSASGGDAAAPIDPPAGLALPLRPYQLDGFRWLHARWANGVGAVLADDMGLGKTVQTLALVAHAAGRSSTGGHGAPFLVVAPTSVASNWVAEAARFTPGLRVASVTATERRRSGSAPLAELARDADLVITTYAVLRLEATAFAAIEWGGLVLDEAQFVKNAATKVHDAARGIRSPFVLAVTGTPIENNLSELWAILRLVAPGLFPSRRAFDERYRRPIELDGNTERRERLRRRIRPLVLRRTKEQVAPELPDKQEQVLTVELAPKHRRLYDATLQRERRKLLGLLADEDDRQRFIVYRSLTLLRMLALDAALIDPEAHDGMPSAKLDALFEQFDDVLAEGHRALVFSQFTSFLARASARLDTAGVSYAYLDGSTPVKRRDAEIARFRAGEASVFLISLKAGGFGLNLTEADYVFLLDPWWNPASEAQAVDRAHRIGQTRPVNVYRLVAAGTIEEKVMALKARKGELVASVLDGVGLDGVEASASPDGALTAADLRELLAD
ncbi:DEAD/DEAH box helicase [Agromyces larvae]|uniref:DEAD/DEAH box helicase n=1 Tax=Agromyces larvae TaxID=2929802 RepID=A0ABY4BUJ8_9MICO|nr:DEAD/DEAH box helicase [Agromyces larvae]UOE42873.1 DEAD/DEAH box helicase [Agromyces larvae]